MDQKSEKFKYFKCSSGKYEANPGKLLEGLVIGVTTKEPLPFAIIYTKDTKRGTMADLDGKCKFVIPDSLLTDKIYLAIASIGYEKTEVTINKKDLPITQNLDIVPAEQVLIGEVIIVKKIKAVTNIVLAVGGLNGFVSTTVQNSTSFFD